MYRANTVAPALSGRLSLRKPAKPVPSLRRKLVIVGDGACGKTSLLMVQAHATFPTAYVPTVFENFVAEITSPTGKLVELALWDTAGQEDYDRLRPLSYPDTDVVLVCFSIDKRESLSNVLTRWAPEVEHFCDGVPKILVGLKTDLRSQQGDRPGPQLISPEEAQEVAYKIGAWRYVECSAKMRDGVTHVFDTAVQAVFDCEKKESRRKRYKLLKKYTRCTIV